MAGTLEHGKRLAELIIQQQKVVREPQPPIAEILRLPIVKSLEIPAPMRI